MKKTIIILAAFVLALVLTQCKKEQAPTIATEENGIRITLDLGSNSRAQVDPNNPQTNGEGVYWAPVSFETNDTIYVGYKGSFVGKLGFNSNKFNGTLNGDLVESLLNIEGDNHLHFYLLGGKGFTPTPTSTGFTVDISDQTGGYPVIAYAASNEVFSVENTTYTAKLKHKASIMKFDVTTRSTAPICITGMNNKVTLNFNPETEGTDEGFTYGINTEDGGLIKMPAKDANNETWAIVLPQAALEASETDGSANSYDDPYYYSSTRPAIHKIESNKYYHENNDVIAMAMNSRVVDLSKLTHHYEANDGDTLSGVLAGNYKISVNTDGAEVTLRNVNITNLNKCDWAGINCENNTTLVLEGTNTVCAGTGSEGWNNYPGIYIKKDMTLTINGDGTLTAYGDETESYAAGIGAGYQVDCGNIVINSGIVNATGGTGCAGIGGGWDASCGYISINSGTITADGGAWATGIGAGYANKYDANCGDITISGGTIFASSRGWGAGIGSGVAFGLDKASSCGNITVTGGEVTATGGDGGDLTQSTIGYTGYETVAGGAGIGTGGAISEPYAYGYGYMEGGYSTCGNIEIGSGVIRVTATKGGGVRPATNSIGKNDSQNPGTCGTVTIGCTFDEGGNPIGGTVYPNGISTSPYTYP